MYTLQASEHSIITRANLFCENTSAAYRDVTPLAEPASGLEGWVGFVAECKNGTELYHAHALLSSEPALRPRVGRQGLGSLCSQGNFWRVSLYYKLRGIGCTFPSLELFLKTTQTFVNKLILDEYQYRDI